MGAVHNLIKTVTGNPKIIVSSEDDSLWFPVPKVFTVVVYINSDISIIDYDSVRLEYEIEMRERCTVTFPAENIVPEYYDLIFYQDSELELVLEFET